MKFVKWIFRFLLLFILFLIFFTIGGMIVSSAMPANTQSEPGLVSPESGVLLIAFVNVIIIIALIRTSRFSGWKLMLGLSLAYYGAVTFLTQIETWYFLTSITVGPALLPRLFLMGIPVAFLYIPLAVWILGKREKDASTPQAVVHFSVNEWILKLSSIAVIYVILYYSAGYFIAWQNPSLRAFYGHSGDPQPFFASFAGMVRSDPFFFPFQIFRAMLWTLCALPVIRGSRLNSWWTALLVGLFFSVPQNIVQILSNPLIPNASVRMSHMIETSSSTFLFGAFVVWLLHRSHRSWRDLFGLK